MQDFLFRKAALDNQSNRFVSSTPLLMPLSFAVSSLFVLLVAGSLVTLLLLGRYTPKDTVRGYVTTAVGGVEIYSHSDGTIRELLVAEGESVSKNQAILSLTTSRALGRSHLNSGRIIAALQSEQADLAEQTLREKEAFDMQARAAEAHITSLESRLRLLRDQRSDLDARLDLSKRALQRLTTLDSQDFISQEKLDEGRADVVDLKLRLREVNLAADAVQADVRQQELRLVEIPILRDRRDAEMRVKRHQLSIEVAKNTGHDAQPVLAPSSGVVSGLLVRDGQTISASSPLLSIVPDNANFHVELMIPTRTSAFVRAQAPVNIRFDAYPYQKFGTYKGVIESVSRTTVMPTDKRFRIPISAPMYIARVRLLKQGVFAYGDSQSLQSGMTLTADVMRDERRLIQWIFEPFIGAAKRL